MLVWCITTQLMLVAEMAMAGGESGLRERRWLLVKVHESKVTTPGKGMLGPELMATPAPTAEAPEATLRVKVQLVKVTAASTMPTAPPVPATVEPTVLLKNMVFMTTALCSTGTCPMKSDPPLEGWPSLAKLSLKTQLSIMMFAPKISTAPPKPPMGRAKALLWKKVVPMSLTVPEVAAEMAPPDDAVRFLNMQFITMSIDVSSTRMAAPVAAPLVE
mmetsp:Transcript_130536/g.194400  ORF Transcript_130536/g.194400 Transcript_130536/m.194400 type:complete len:217 (-) Transcript_130536:1563-2213(-)